MIKLNSIDKYKKCKILKLDTNPLITRRLMDIGLIPGSITQKVLINPFGSICAYSIMGTTIAIRNKDVEGVYVEYA